MRDVETLENLTAQTKRDLIKTFTKPDHDIVVDNIINVNDWGNKTKNELDLATEQVYKESASEMIKANNADLLQQMFSQKINEQKIRKYEELAKKIQPSLDLFFT